MGIDAHQHEEDQTEAQLHRQKAQHGHGAGHTGSIAVLAQIVHLKGLTAGTRRRDVIIIFTQHRRLECVFDHNASYGVPHHHAIFISLEKDGRGNAPQRPNEPDHIIIKNDMLGGFLGKFHNTGNHNRTDIDKHKQHRKDHFVPLFLLLIGIGQHRRFFFDIVPILLQLLKLICHRKPPFAKIVCPLYHTVTICSIFFCFSRQKSAVRHIDFLKKSVIIKVSIPKKGSESHV